MSLSSENTERTCKCHCCPRAPRPAAHSGRSAPPGAPAAPPAHPMSPLPAPLHPAFSPVSSQSFRLEELRMVIRVQLWSSLRAGRSCVSSGRPPPSLPSHRSPSWKIGIIHALLICRSCFKDQMVSVWESTLPSTCALQSMWGCPAVPSPPPTPSSRCGGFLPVL